MNLVTCPQSLFCPQRSISFYSWETICLCVASPGISKGLWRLITQTLESSPYSSLLSRPCFVPAWTVLILISASAAQQIPPWHALCPLYHVNKWSQAKNRGIGLAPLLLPISGTEVLRAWCLRLFHSDLFYGCSGGSRSSG